MLEDSKSFTASVVGLVLVSFLTLPSIVRSISHLRASKSENAIYEDKDGIATEKSMREFSAKTPKILISLFSVAGLLASIALAILDTIHEVDGLFVENWCNAAAWVSPGDAVLIMLISPRYFFWSRLWAFLSSEIRSRLTHWESPQPSRRVLFW